jgi:hypothetical protein
MVGWIISTDLFVDQDEFRQKFLADLIKSLKVIALIDVYDILEQYT